MLEGVVYLQSISGYFVRIVSRSGAIVAIVLRGRVLQARSNLSTYFCRLCSISTTGLQPYVIFGAGLKFTVLL